MADKFYFLLMAITLLQDHAVILLAEQRNDAVGLHQGSAYRSDTDTVKNVEGLL